MKLSDIIAKGWYLHMLEHYTKPERIAFLKQQKNQQYWLEIARGRSDRLETMSILRLK